ncbi:MAG: hypothetical protein ACRDNB_08720 [Gaiellaceae bacterium]
MRALAAVVLLLAGLGCGGGGSDGDRFAVYHLELAIGPAGTEGELRCGRPRTCPGVVAQPAPREVRYAVLGPPGVGEDGIDRSALSANGAVVSVALTPQGRAEFARLTREVARYGGRDQGWHHIAVVVGDEIVAFPEIDFDAHPDGIVGARAVRFAAAGDADARDLVERLRGG